MDNRPGTSARPTAALTAIYSPPVSPARPAAPVSSRPGDRPYMADLVGGTAESLCATVAAACLSLKGHSHGLQRQELARSAQPAVRSHSPAPQTALTTRYQPVISAACLNLILSIHPKSACIEIRSDDYPIRSRSGRISRAPNTFRQDLRHSHHNVISAKRAHSRTKPGHNRPVCFRFMIKPLRAARGQKPGYTACSPDFSPTMTGKLAVIDPASPTIPGFPAATYAFTGIYPPLTIVSHRHLHTYPPFKGGKCNSGSDQEAR